MDALLVIDVQNDFCPGGALAVPHGDEVIESLNRLMRQHDLVVATRDWHPADHFSFAAQGGPWPAHCVQDTPGAELHRDLDRSAIDVVIDKGQGASDEGYSGFEHTELERLLRDRGVERVHVGGLALDYCVKHTALDALRLGFPVTVHLAATRPVEVEAGDGERAIEELRRAGAEIEGPVPNAVFKTIAWATDGSECADVALSYAKALAARDGAALVAIHSKELLLGPRAGGFPVHPDEDERKEKISRQVEEIAGEGIDASLKIVAGPSLVGAAHMIAEAAAEIGADLIVAGTRGHTPLAGLLVGSVTQRLLQIASCPVLVVPAPRQP